RVVAVLEAGIDRDAVMGKRRGDAPGPKLRSELTVRGAQRRGADARAVDIEVVERRLADAAVLEDIPGNTRRSAHARRGSIVVVHIQGVVDAQEIEVELVVVAECRIVILAVDIVGQRAVVEYVALATDHCAIVFVLVVRYAAGALGIAPPDEAIRTIRKSRAAGRQDATGR